ncbi:MAG: twin-arginine translocase subunit TatC [Acidimicrobiales bacterium]
MSAQPDPSALDAGRMTLWEHIAELRQRLIKVAIGVGVGTILGWVLYPYVLEFLTAPYKQIQPDAKLYAMSLLEGFTVRIQTSVYLGIIFAMPVILWQIWRFVTPGLYPHEKKYAIPFTVSALVLFLFGAAIAYWTLPAAIQFLIGVSGSEVEIIPGIESYLKLNLFMMMAFGAGFEFPVLLVALQLAGVLTPRRLNSWRRQAIVVVVVVAAVITPSGDPISMLALAIPMYVFYEASILIGWLLTRRRRKKEAEAAASP